MDAIVEVVITDIRQAMDPFVIVVEYRVDNHERESVWLVDDGWLVWSQQGVNIKLSYARARLQPGAEVFGYFNPKVVEVESEESVMRNLELESPLSLSRLWNADSTATLRPGIYQFSVQIGYGRTREPPDPVLGEAVETPVLAWQRLAASPPVWMEVDGPLLDLGARR